jgi:hypothetical protein
MILNCLKNYIKNKNKFILTNDDFNNILDLFSEYLRPNIINILNYLKKKKQANICYKIMLYTNNVGPREWVEKIISYLEKKIDYKLFDQIIAAFKVNGKRIEMCRTTNEKTIGDFIKCTKLPAKTEICFLDDTYHSEMMGDNVYYIKMNPYVHNLPFDEIVDRFSRSNLRKQIIGEEYDEVSVFKLVCYEYIKEMRFVFVEKTKEEYEIDKIVSKKTMILLQDFFKKSWNDKTQKMRQTSKNKRNTTTKRKTL